MFYSTFPKNILTFQTFASLLFDFPESPDLPLPVKISPTLNTQPKRSPSPQSFPSTVQWREFENLKTQTIDWLPTRARQQVTLPSLNLLLLYKWGFWITGVLWESSSKMHVGCSHCGNAGTSMCCKCSQKKKKKSIQKCFEIAIFMLVVALSNQNWYLSLSLRTYLLFHISATCAESCFSHSPVNS